MIAWGPSGAKGRGVYARTAIQAGETIEVAPVIVFPEPQWKPIDETPLTDYPFIWDRSDGSGAIVLGLGSIYNHSFTPNAYYARNLEARTVDFVALRDIGVGEEICTNYNGDVSDESPVWFSVKRAVRRNPADVGGRPYLPGSASPDTPVRVAPSPGKGRGVFATRLIREGETIEHAPAVVLPGTMWPEIDATVLTDYAFFWGPENEEIAIVLGWGSIYNHDYDPNAIWHDRPENVGVEFVALRDIAPGEEICTNYNRDPADQTPVWFPVNGSSARRGIRTASRR